MEDNAKSALGVPSYPARPTEASICAINVGSSGDAASAETHSRSSVRFFTPSTTVETPSIESA